MSKIEYPPITDNKKYPPVAFYFEVIIDNILDSSDNFSGDNSFQEVSGLNTELEIEDVAEGGENRFTHHLPKAIKHPRLVLKRGLAHKSSTLVSWCISVLESDFGNLFLTKNIVINLLGANIQGDTKETIVGAPLRSWSIGRALPVSWEFEPFNSTSNNVAIEKIEFTYNELNRLDVN